MTNMEIGRKSCLCVCGHWKGICLSSKKGDGEGDKQERFTRSFCKSGDEPLSGSKDESLSGINDI